MTILQTAPANERLVDRTRWCYVSGRVNALETQLVPRSFFEAILKCADAREAGTLLGKTRYRGVSTNDRSFGGYGDAIAASGDGLREELFAQSPVHPLKEFWRLPARYKRVRVLFLRRAAAGAAGEELAEMVLSLAPSPGARLALGGAAEAARGRKFSGDAVATSLLLDSAACEVMAAVARLAPERDVKSVLSDRATIAAWSSVVRRTSNGTPVDVLRRWFRFSGDGEGFPEDISRTSSPADALAGRVSRWASDYLRGLPWERIKEDIDSAAGEALREGVLRCRRFAFGAERLLFYLCALEAEETNLRIALAAVVENLDREVARSRLRREYV